MKWLGSPTHTHTHTQVILTFSISLLLCVIFLFFTLFSNGKKVKNKNVLKITSTCVDQNMIPNTTRDFFLSKITIMAYKHIDSNMGHFWPTYERVNGSIILCIQGLKYHIKHRTVDFIQRYYSTVGFWCCYIPKFISQGCCCYLDMLPRWSDV